MAFTRMDGGIRGPGQAAERACGRDRRAAGATRQRRRGTQSRAANCRRALPGWVLSRADLPFGADTLAGWATVAGLVLEVILWPILGLALLLGPIVVVAECSVAAALRQWYGLLRRHLSRVLLYEALAI